MLDERLRRLIRTTLQILVIAVAGYLAFVEYSPEPRVNINNTDIKNVEEFND